MVPATTLTSILIQKLSSCGCIEPKSDAILSWRPLPPLLPRFEPQHLTEIVLMHEKMLLSTGAYPGLHMGKLRLLKGVFSSTCSCIRG